MLKFSIDNILNPAYKIQMGDKSRIEITETDLTVREYKKGVGFSMNYILYILKKHLTITKHKLKEQVLI